MSTYNHSPISTGAAANAGVVNTPIGQLDAALGQLSALTTTNKVVANAINEVNANLIKITGGSTISGNQLIAWAESGAYQLSSITYHVTYTNVVSTATVLWPDGSGGTFTATTINTTWEAIDAYTITHSLSSKTVTQSAVTRNSDGNVTVKPNLSVA